MSTRPHLRRLRGRRWVELSLLAGLCLASVAAAAERPAQAPTLEALPLGDERIVVDGILDEPAWQKAERIEDFWQRDPDEGKPATERTEVRVAYSSTILYVAVRAYHADPSTIVAKEMERDAPLHRDDSVALLFDTFHDRRNAYSFETNPNGARKDVLIADEGRDINPQWDGVWTVACRRDDEGWTAEFAVPFSTLRFDRNQTTWGFNVRRMIRHRDEEVHWAAIGRDVGSDARDLTLYALYRVSLAGELKGLGRPERSRQLAIKPFSVGRVTERRDSDASTRVDTGLDVKWGVSRALLLDLTYNTDFAEVEVDQQQFNLTRFSLFFPEKREFFLENSGIFEFGLPVRDPMEPALMKLFFSRRIGLDAGREVPMEGGVRLTGRAAGWNVGLLGALTEDSRSNGAPGSGLPETTFAVARAKRNIGRRSGLGVLYTDRNASGAGRNRTLGIDVDFKPNDRIDVAAFIAQSDDDSVAGDDWAAGYSVGLATRSLRASVEHSITSAGFVPGTGFLLRGNYERINPLVRWRPRVNRFGILNWFMEAELDYLERQSTGELESRFLTVALLGLRTVHDDAGSLNWVSETERLFEPFEIQPGIVIPPGVYSFDSLRLGGRSNESRAVGISGRLQSGDFFGGRKDQASVTLRVRPSRFIKTETSINGADVELPQGDFTTTIVGQRLDLAWSPDLRFNAFLQYNDSAELLAANLRFNWIYRPGADLFIVFNQNWDAPTLGQRQRRDRQLVVKFTYLFQR